MQAHIYPTPPEVIEAIAERIIELCNEILNRKEFCTIVLSGGNSPKALYQLLASDKYKNQVDWNRCYFFFGDERNVPFNHADNNGGMAKENLFDPLDIKKNQIFYIDTSLDPAAAAKNYEEKIRSFFGSGEKSFDLILLGLGDNAHTASLFPGSELLNETNSDVKEVFISSLNAFRITLTAPLINRSKHILFLVYGASKADAVYNVIRAEKNINQYPAQLIHAVSGGEEWFMDEAAASRLQ